MDCEIEDGKVKVNGLLLSLVVQLLSNREELYL